MPTKTPVSRQDAIDRFLSAPGEQSFKDLFLAVAPSVVCFFRTRGCNYELAEDLTQEVMLAVYRAVDTLRQPELFRAWLFGIARNALLRHARDTGRRPSTVPFADNDEGTWVHDSDPLLGPQFAEWMAALEPEERRIMILRYIDEMEHHEIASLLGIPVGTVQWKVYRARKKLAARFGNGEADLS